jgi:hypothetical protein
VVARERAASGSPSARQFASQARDFGRRAGLLLPDQRQTILEQPGRLRCVLTLLPHLVQAQQVGQQALDLAVAVGRQWPLALGREHRREEGLRRAEQFAHGLLVDIDLAVADGAVGKHHRLPVAVGLLEQEGLGLALAIDAKHKLRFVAVPPVLPGQFLLAFR